MSAVNWKSRFESCEARRRYAWGKYFEQLEDRRDEAQIIVSSIETGLGKSLPKMPEKDVILPPHITREFYEMGIKLKKDFTCPICMDIPAKNDFVITMCGHSYCQNCLNMIKASANAKCAICRKELK